MNTLNTQKELRDLWSFPYPAAALAKAAAEKRKHHLARVAWWEKQKAAVMKRIKAKGLTVDEGVAASYATSGAVEPRIQVATELARHLSEAHNKIKEHSAKAKIADGWHQVLSHQPKQMQLPLTHVDWLFFFGR